MVPISGEEKEYFFNHATHSDGTALWYGAKYGDSVPDKSSFFKDWQGYYFKDIENRKGRYFHIIQKGSKIGQINYNEIQSNEVDVDIIIYDKDNWSKGYGSSAIKLISAYLEEKYHVDKIWIDVHPHNTRAIKAYEKAGFNSKSKTKDELGIDYIRLSRKNRYK